MVAGGILPTFDQDEDQYDLPNTFSDQLDHRKGESGTHTQLKKKLSLSSAQNPPNIIYLMAVLSAMGGFLFGYDTGIVSGAMVFVKKTFSLNSLWQEIVVSITILGAWVLSLMAGGLSERYGRKTIILYASIIFTVGSIVMGFAWSKYILLFGRLVVGMAIGLASTGVPMYIAEVAPSNIRGSLVTLNNCFITVGQLTAAITAGAFSYDHENGWRWMLSLAAVPAVVQFLGFMFMPESPRWLIRRQRDDEALVALKRIRGPKNPYVLREFDKIRQNQLELTIQEDRRREQKRNIFVAIMRKTATRRALFVGCSLQAIQQLAGINTVMYYTATIIEMSGVQSQSIAVWLAVPTAAVYVIFSFCGYLLADRLGRRTLTLGSLMGVILSLLLLGTGFQLTSMNGAVVTTHNLSTSELCYSKSDCSNCILEPKCGFCYDGQNLGTAYCLEKNPDDNTRSIGGDCAEGGSPNFVFATNICPSMTQGISLNTWLVLTGLVMYLASFAPGMGPMPWTINSEIYPMWARSFCYSISTSVNWMFNLLISLTFISLTEVLTKHGCFYMYSFIASIGWLLLFWKLPETRGRSLEDISQLFAKAKPDDQDIIDDETSGNQSTIGVGGVVGNQQLNLVPTKLGAGVGHRHSVVLGHDNLAFANEHLHSQNQQLAKSAPTTDPSILLERSRSFKLASPLSKATSMVIHQPDNQSQCQKQQSQSQQHLQQTQQVPPTPPPVPSFATLVSSQKQRQQQQQSKRKYSDGGLQERRP